MNRWNRFFQRPIHHRIEIFCTVIFGQFGGIHSGILQEIGYTKKMVRKCPSLFMRRGLSAILEWLAIKGVKTVDIVSCKNERWNQIHFSWGQS